MKIVLEILFLAIGLFACCYSITISMDGMADKQIMCLKGAEVFIHFELETYIVRVLLLLFLNKKIL